MSDEEIAADKKTSVAAVREEEREAHADFEDFLEEGLEPVTRRTSAAFTRPASSGASLGLVLAWAAVGVPLLWGVWTTLIKAFALFR